MHGEKLAPLAVERFRGQGTGNDNITHSENSFNLFYSEILEIVALGEFITAGTTEKTKYLSSRNQFIYETMVLLYEQNGFADAKSLIEYLTEYNEIDRGLEIAGGAEFLRNVLGGYESERAAMWRQFAGGA
jgi:protein involved in sex pheromone biosynthesis